LEDAVSRLAAAEAIPEADGSCAEVSEPKNRDHGDFSTNFALIEGKRLGIAPPKLGALLAEELEKDDAIANATSAGPGFVNIRLSDAYLSEWAEKAANAEKIVDLRAENPQKILIEFVSVNPNGPLHLGHGRGAAYGDTLARALAAGGHAVSREYYVNDGVNSTQMQLFALSVKALYRKQAGLPFEFPEGGYKGESVEEIARDIREKFGDGHDDDGLDFWQTTSQDMMLAVQKRDLERFGVVFDRWFSEQSLHDSGAVAEALEILKKKGSVYEQDGALFLKSTEYGDDRDRCVIRAGGAPTYIASDIAYHKDKFDRGFDHLIDVWGPDHHGYVQRTQAAMQALGYGKERLELIITQIVRFIVDGKPAPMRKRNGEYYRLADLIDELGADVVRYFYLMRSHETHMDFDIDLAKEHSDKNPVFYIQYAHARISSLIEKAAAEGLRPDASHTSLLNHVAERRLILKIWDLPNEVLRIVEDRGVHRLTTYATELAREYHNFYDKCPVIKAETKPLAEARLALCVGARKALRETFSLLGISAPTSM
jgi:arginyl-tRNA synthetase